MTSLPSKTILPVSMLLVFSISAFAQGSKPHFVINNPDKPAEVQVYYDMLKDFNFESYRFLDQRRVIKFVNSNVTLELYSAKELKTLYQKEISPLTIMDNKPKSNIAFLVQGGKVQVVTIK